MTSLPHEVLKEMMPFRLLRSLSRFSRDFVTNEYIDSLIRYPTSDEIKNFLSGTVTRGGKSKMLDSGYAWGCGYEKTESSSDHSVNTGEVLYLEKSQRFGSSKFDSALFNITTTETFSSYGYEETELKISLKTENRFNPPLRSANDSTKFIFLDVVSIMAFHHEKPEFVLAKNTYGEALCHHRLKLAMINLISDESEDISSYTYHENIRRNFAMAYINCQVLEISPAAIKKNMYNLNFNIVDYSLDVDDDDDKEILNLKSEAVHELLKSMIELLSEKIATM